VIIIMPGYPCLVPNASSFIPSLPGKGRKRRESTSDGLSGKTPPLIQSGGCHCLYFYTGLIFKNLLKGFFAYLKSNEYF